MGRCPFFVVYLIDTYQPIQRTASQGLDKNTKILSPPSVAIKVGRVVIKVIQHSLCLAHRFPGVLLQLFDHLLRLLRVDVPELRVVREHHVYNHIDHRLRIELVGQSLA